MGIQIDKNRSDAYIGTFSYECADDMLQLQDVRAMVKNMNKSLREAKMDYNFRVVLRGRQPNTSYDYFGNVVGGIGNATKVDAYIYRRR
jgi:hypothetical protein